MVPHVDAGTKIRMSYRATNSPVCASQSSSCGSPYSVSDASPMTNHSPNHSAVSDDALSPTTLNECYGQNSFVPHQQQQQQIDSFSFLGQSLAESGVSNGRNALVFTFDARDTALSALSQKTIPSSLKDSARGMLYVDTCCNLIQLPSPDQRRLDKTSRTYPDVSMSKVASMEGAAEETTSRQPTSLHSVCSPAINWTAVKRKPKKTRTPTPTLPLAVPNMPSSPPPFHTAVMPAQNRLSSTPTSPQVAVAMEDIETSGTTTDKSQLHQPKGEGELASYMVMPSLTVDPAATATPYSDATQSRKRAKDGHIKRPMNAFMIWSQQKRREIIAHEPEKHNADISRYLGVAWKDLSKELKDKYKEEARRLRAFHVQEYPDYKYQPRKNKAKQKKPTKTESGRVTKPRERSGSSPKKTTRPSRAKTGNSRKPSKVSPSAQALPVHTADAKDSDSLVRLGHPFQNTVACHTANGENDDIVYASEQMTVTPCAESSALPVPRADNTSPAARGQSVAAANPTTASFLASTASSVYYNPAKGVPHPVSLTSAANQGSNPSHISSPGPLLSLNLPTTRIISTSQSSLPVVSGTDMSSTAPLEDFEDLLDIDTTGMVSLLLTDRSHLHTSTIMSPEDIMTVLDDSSFPVFESVTDDDVTNVPAAPPEKMFSEGL